jgi:hypothetical protein
VEVVSSNWAYDTITWAIAETLSVLGANLLDSPTGSRSHPITIDVTDLYNTFRNQLVTFRMSPLMVDTLNQGPYQWYSARDTSPSPNRGPELLLTFKGVDEFFAYLERDVGSLFAERLR